MNKQYELHEKNNYLIIEILVEKVDFFDTPDIAHEFEDIIELKDFPNVIFDLNHITYIDSSGIGFLISIRNKLKNNKSELTTVCSNPDIIHIMELLKVPQFFKIFRNRQDAENYFLNRD